MFELPSLKYPFNALEPFIDAKTMEIHYLKHHQTYIDKLNETIKDYPDLGDKSVESLLADIASVPQEIRQKVINFGGGHANHSLFWDSMRPDAAGFDNSWFDPIKDEFVQKATTLFGSGWVWVVKNGNKLEVVATTNQDSPLTQGKKPILCIDLWEHAYYLKYQNRRQDYIDAWLSVANWENFAS